MWHSMCVGDDRNLAAAAEPGHDPKREWRSCEEAGAVAQPASFFDSNVQPIDPLCVPPGPTWSAALSRPTLRRCTPSAVGRTTEGSRQHGQSGGRFIRGLIIDGDSAIRLAELLT